MTPFILLTNLLLGQCLVGAACLCSARHQLGPGLKGWGLESLRPQSHVWLMLAVGWDLTWTCRRSTYMWPFHVAVGISHSMGLGFQEQASWERATRKLIASSNLAPEATWHQFCHILFARSELPRMAQVQVEGIKFYSLMERVSKNVWTMFGDCHRFHGAYLLSAAVSCSLLAVSCRGSVSAGWLLVTPGKADPRCGRPSLTQEPQLHKRHGSNSTFRPIGTL